MRMQVDAAVDKGAINSELRRQFGMARDGQEDEPRIALANHAGEPNARTQSPQIMNCKKPGGQESGERCAPPVGSVLTPGSATSVGKRLVKERT